MECLVTQLKERVNNNNIIPLNSIFVHIDASSVSVEVGADSKGVVGKIITPGVTFTNGIFSGLTEQEFPNGSYRTCSVSAECDMIISNASHITRLQQSGGGGLYFARLNLDGMYGNSVLQFINIGKSNGDIKALKGMSQAKSIVLKTDASGIGLYGNVENLPLSSALYALTISGSPNVEGSIDFVSSLPVIADIDLSYGKISGNISAFANLSSLRDVTLTRTLVEGNIGSFAGISTLRNLQLFGCAITGNLSQLINVPALKDATFPDSVYYTSEDASRIDALMESNGGTMKSSGHYFLGGTQI